MVYGKLAIATALDLRTKASFSAVQHAQNQVELDLPDLNASYEFPDAEQALSLQDDPAARAFLTVYLAIRHRFAAEAPPRTVRASFMSQLPIGAGLGSSASYSACIALGLVSLYRAVDVSAVEDRSLVNEFAFLSEKVLHGNPSGVDNATVVHGGFLSYRSGQFKQIQFSEQLRFLLIHTRVPRNTKELVAGVRRLRDSMPTVVDPILQAIDAISTRFENGQSENLKEMIAVNHSLLNALGVGHPSLETCVRICAKHTLTCKLTGAGGGGCAIVYVAGTNSNSEADAAKRELEEAGMRVFETAIGAAGVNFC